MRLLTILLIFFCVVETSTPYSQKYDDEREIALLKRKLHKNPQDTKSLFRMGWFMQKKNLPSLADKYYRRCLKLNPRYVAAWINLGNVYKRKKKFGQAESFYKKAIYLKANSSQAYYNLGTLYLKMKDYNNAMLYLEKMLKISPRHKWAKEAHLNLGSIYLKLFISNGTHTIQEKAARHLRAAIRIDNRYAHAYFNLGKLYDTVHDIPNAIKYYRESIRFYKNNSAFKLFAHDRITALNSETK